MDWHNAQLYCQRLHENAYLAEIQDQYSFQLITETLLYSYILEFGWTNLWWLGGSDLVKVVELLHFQIALKHTYMICNCRKDTGFG